MVFNIVLLPAPLAPMSVTIAAHLQRDTVQTNHVVVGSDYALKPSTSLSATREIGFDSSGSSCICPAYRLRACAR
jgi:hypothetical protein